MKVVIVGAGPAGLITALNLIQEGISPLVLEKHSSIRSTACAEACGIQSLNKLPFNSKPYIGKFIKRAKLIYPDDTSSYINKSTVALNRTDWQNGMAEEIEARGGQVRLNSEVVAIEEDNIRLKSGDKIGYEILIGADGPNSRVARHLGIRHQSVVASQYKLAIDTSDMDCMQFYLDHRFSPNYAWIIPKDGVINVGIEGNFTRLDKFLRHKGLTGCRIIKKEAGIIPTSGIQKLVQRRIALIGDSAAMTNCFSGGGLTPIICAARILAGHIGNLEAYEREVKKHAIAAPVLPKAWHLLSELSERELTEMLRLLTVAERGNAIFPTAVGILKHPSLILKTGSLIDLYQALKITKNYGW